MTMGLVRTAARSAIQHPWIALLFAACFIAGMSVAFGGSGDSEDRQARIPGTQRAHGEYGTLDQPPSLTPSPSPAAAPLVADKRYKRFNNSTGRDPRDLDPEPPAPQPDHEITRYRPEAEPFDVYPSKQADAVDELNSNRALQELPIQRRTYGASIHDKAPDGRIVIMIQFSGSKPLAARRFTRFLRRHHDSGANYILIYRRK